MNPITAALHRPITVLVAAVGVVFAGGLAYSRMRVDIFPPLNLPVIYVCQPYGGMDPQQMEGLIANYYEYHFLYINGIHHVESRNVQGMSLMKLFFHPGTDMAQAMSETVGYVNRARAFMPPGTVNPFIMRFDTGSVPVGYLVLSSETRTIDEIQDKALFRVRPMFAAIEGVSAPPPFGGSQRTIVVRLDPQRLKAHGLSADDVVQKLSDGNTIAPSGQIREAMRMPLVPSNAMVVRPEELGAIEMRPGIFLRDVVQQDPVTHRPMIDDASDIPTGYALVNGKRAVYIPVTKRAQASTLEVVKNVRANLPKMQAELPDDIHVSFELDQSPFVTRAMQNVALEGLMAALLVGLMVLLFLRDWRSVIVVVLNIPLALIAALVALWLSGQTINLMTLGGLALAVGILVDEATVAVENVHVHRARTPSLALAVWRGVAETAVPRLLAMLCILAVFIPSLLMPGAAGALFLPLTLAVGFAMVASYILSSTFVPILCVWLLTPPTHTSSTLTISDRPTRWRRAVLAPAAFLVRWRYAVLPFYLLATSSAMLLLGPRLGMDIFPQVDTGTFQLRLRAPTGTRIEETEALTQEALRFIQQEVHKLGGEVAISLGYVGVVGSSYPINAIYLWMGGPHESAIRIQLRPGSVSLSELQSHLREKLPGHLQSWLAARWKQPRYVLPDAVAEQRAREVQVSFEPADIVNEIMSFGAPTPVEIQIAGASLPSNRLYAEHLLNQLRSLTALQDLQFVQTLDYPTIQVQFDREKLAFSGVTTAEAARAMVPFTSSSRFTVPNYWRDPSSGIGYQVQVEVPYALVQQARDLELIPVSASGTNTVYLRDVAQVSEGVMPGQIDRYNMKRVVSLMANIQGSDLGRVRRQLTQAITAANASLWSPVDGFAPPGQRLWKNRISQEVKASAEPPDHPPRGISVDIRGQITPFQELFRNLTLGLAVAVVVIVLMLVAYYQSLRLAVAAVVPIAASLVGVTGVLLITGTTLNVQSFMGAIMAVGVVTANAILLVTFAERARQAGQSAPEAGLTALRERMRAILMTSTAMIAGMLPMAWGLGEGGDQTAPLGRAVVGGLVAGTATTLLVLPAVFAVVMGRSPARSPSLSPFHPESRYYVPAAQESSHAS